MFVIIIKLTDLNSILLPQTDPLSDLSILSAITTNGAPVDDENMLQTETLELVHIRVYQRKSRKYVTTIEGIPRDLKLKPIVKYMKKKFSCSGVIKTELKNDVEKSIIQLSGDQRDNISNFLVDKKIVEKRQIKVHGF